VYNNQLFGQSPAIMGAVGYNKGLACYLQLHWQREPIYLARLDDSINIEENVWHPKQAFHNAFPFVYC